MVDPRADRITGLCGVLAPIIGLSSIARAISKAPWFSWSSNALSDLGVGPTSGIFNTGLLAAGFLALLLSVGLFRSLFRDLVGRAGSLAFALSACSLMAIGWFPESAGRIHFWVSVAFFVTLPVSMILLGISMLISGRHRLTVLMMIVAAVIAGGVWALPHDGPAIPEIVSSVTGSVWVLVFGLLLLIPSLRKRGLP